MKSGCGIASQHRCGRTLGYRDVFVKHTTLTLCFYLSLARCNSHCDEVYSNWQKH